MLLAISDASVLIDLADSNLLEPLTKLPYNLVELPVSLPLMDPKKPGHLADR